MSLVRIRLLLRTSRFTRSRLQRTPAGIRRVTSSATAPVSHPSSFLGNFLGNFVRRYFAMAGRIRHLGDRGRLSCSGPFGGGRGGGLRIRQG